MWYDGPEQRDLSNLNSEARNDVLFASHFDFITNVIVNHNKDINTVYFAFANEGVFYD
jgi:hypothetical protein